MKTWLIPLSLVLAGLAGGVARAEDCRTLVHDIMAKHPTIIEYCEACGDKAPDEPVVATTLDVDIEHTYVQMSPKLYQNLAMLAGCPVDGVTPSLTVADETSHGVLITPSDVRPTRMTLPAPAPAPPPNASTVYVYSSTAERTPWIVIVFACGAGFATGAGFLLLALAMRRRRAMRPRASELHVD